MEYELKYAATPLAIPESILTDRELMAFKAGELTEIPMETTYYDTADRAMGSRRCTFRLRREGARQVITLKTPIGIAHARGEYECEALSLAEGIPQLIALGAPAELFAAPEAYVPVCGARFLRRLCLLEREGMVCELAVDNGILFKEDRQLSFSELELELKAGTPAQLEAFAEPIRARYGLHEEPKSKFARASAL